MTELTVHLRKPHPKQLDFISSLAKRKVICTGRRSGKTTGVGILAVKDFLAGKRILYAAPTQDQTDRFWQEVKVALDEPLKAGLYYKNETRRIIELGGTEQRIRAKTSWDADSLRGDYGDVLILEEYSLMNPATWDEVGAPMLLDNNGDAVFIFTPKRKNHAWKLYQRAIGDTAGRWQAWHFTSHENPYLSPEALEEITQDMTEAAYRQEIMAEFLESEGQIFRNLANCMGASLNTTPDNHKDHSIYAGLDWAKSQDFTATSLICKDCKAEVARDRFNRIDYHFQRDRLGVLYQRWNVAYILGETNSIGEPNLEELRRSGLPIRGFATTASSKPPLIENLALCLEKEEAQWQDDPIWTGELEAYEIRMSPNTNRPTYSAPSGMNDDTVIARALAWRAISSRGVFVG
jgi:hypothetical protein